MKRELSGAEKDMAQKIADVIGTLDELVFPKNPVKEIVVVRGNPESESQRVGYASPKNAGSKGEYYQIYGYGLDKVLKEEIGKKRVILLRGPEKKYEDFPKLTLGELLVGIAAHEVRHRVQYHFPIELFSSEISEDIPDFYLRGLVRYIKLLFEEAPPEGDYGHEFDAKVVEYLIMEKWYWGEKDLLQIASIIKAGARNFQLSK